MKKKNRKSGSGRTKGSFSFVRLPLESLCSKLKPETTVVVSRKWAESVGFEANAVSSKDVKSNIAGTSLSNINPEIEGSVIEDALAPRAAVNVIDLDAEPVETETSTT